MRRAAICGAIAVALVAAAVAVGAGTDVRIHRLHVPPPPVGDDSGTSVPPAAGKPNPTNPTDPSVPGTSPPAAPPPAGAQPPPPPAEPPDGSPAPSAGDAATACRDRNARRLRPDAAATTFAWRRRSRSAATTSAASGIPSPSRRRALPARLLCATPAITPATSSTLHGHEPAARQLRDLLHHPPAADVQGHHRQLTARGVRRRARGRRHAAVARASSRRATRRSWPRPRARRRRDGGR